MLIFSDYPDNQVEMGLIKIPEDFIIKFAPKLRYFSFFSNNHTSYDFYNILSEFGRHHIDRCIINIAKLMVNIHFSYEINYYTGNANLLGHNTLQFPSNDYVIQGIPYKLINQGKSNELLNYFIFEYKVDKKSFQIEIYCKQILLRQQI